MTNLTLENIEKGIQKMDGETPKVESAYLATLNLEEFPNAV